MKFIKNLIIRGTPSFTNFGNSSRHSTCEILGIFPKNFVVGLSRRIPKVRTRNSQRDFWWIFSWMKTLALAESGFFGAKRGINGYQDIYFHQTGEIQEFDESNRLLSKILEGMNNYWVNPKNSNKTWELCPRVLLVACTIIMKPPRDNCLGAE